jgi:hypothetical protein
MEAAVSSEILVPNPRKYCLKSQTSVAWNGYTTVHRHLPLKWVTILFPTQHLRWGCFIIPGSVPFPMPWSDKRWIEPNTPGQGDKDIKLPAYSGLHYRCLSQLFLFAICIPSLMFTCIIVETNLQLKEMIGSLGTTQSHLLLLTKAINSSDITGRGCLYSGFVLYYRTHSCTFCLFFFFFFRFYKFYNGRSAFLLSRDPDRNEILVRMLQTGRSWVGFPMMLLDFSIDVLLPATLWLWGRLSL